LVILGTVMVLIITGGIGFTVLTDLFSRARRRTERISYHSKIVLIVTGFLILSGAAVVFIMNASGSLAALTLPEKIFASLFQSVTPRTAGFQVVPQQDFTPLTRLITIILMFVGGSPGSIAGGIKTTTFCIVVLYAIRGNTSREGLNMRGRNVDTATVEKAFSIFAKSMMIVLGSLALLLVTEQARIDIGVVTIFELLFEVVSAFGTVGLTLGATAGLSVLGKIVIIGTMLCGRLGIFAMAIGFARNERERHFEYPSANVMVG
jgi:trk system potassium uptake protein TrkH